MLCQYTSKKVREMTLVYWHNIKCHALVSMHDILCYNIKCDALVSMHEVLCYNTKCDALVSMHEVLCYANTSKKKFVK